MVSDVDGGDVDGATLGMAAGVATVPGDDVVDLDPVLAGDLNQEPDHPDVDSDCWPQLLTTVWLARVASRSCSDAREAGDFAAPHRQQLSGQTADRARLLAGERLPDQPALRREQREIAVRRQDQPGPRAGLPAAPQHLAAAAGVDDSVPVGLHIEEGAGWFCVPSSPQSVAPRRRTSAPVRLHRQRLSPLAGQELAGPECRSGVELDRPGTQVPDNGAIGATDDQLTGVLQHQMVRRTLGVGGPQQPIAGVENSGRCRSGPAGGSCRGPGFWRPRADGRRLGRSGCRRTACST